MIEDNRTPEVQRAVEKAVIKALNEIAVIVHGSAVLRAPVGKYPPGSGVVGGNLRSSITFNVDEGDKIAYIGTNVDYAPHVEYGTRPHIITVRNAKVLSDGQTIFGKTVRHPGTAPQPFLRTGLDENKEKIQKKIRETLKAAIEGATR